MASQTMRIRVRLGQVLVWFNLLGVKNSDLHVPSDLLNYKLTTSFWANLLGFKKLHLEKELEIEDVFIMTFISGLNYELN